MYNHEKHVLQTRVISNNKTVLLHPASYEVCGSKSDSQQCKKKHKNKHGSQ